MTESHGRWRIPSPPTTDAEVYRTLADFRRTLEGMTIPQLTQLAAQQAAAQQEIARSTLRSSLAETLPALDTLTQRTSPSGPGRPSDRGRAAAASPTPDQSRLPGPLELLSRTDRLGRAVAGKLAIAHVRAEARRRAQRG